MSKHKIDPDEQEFFDQCSAYLATRRPPVEHRDALTAYFLVAVVAADENVSVGCCVVDPANEFQIEALALQRGIMKGLAQVMDDGLCTALGALRLLRQRLGKKEFLEVFKKIQSGADFDETMDGAVNRALGRRAHWEK